MSPNKLRKRRRSDVAKENEPPTGAHFVKNDECVNEKDEINAKKECLIQKEVDYPIVLNYLSCQPELTAYMRSVLLDWMAEVSEAYSLQRETFHMSVSFVDRYLAMVCIIFHVFRENNRNCSY